MLARNRLEQLKATETAALVVPPADKVEVDPLDGEYVTVNDANIRAAPTTESQRLNTVRAGTTITVTGKVREADWYRVERAGGGKGYVFASLLKEKAAEFGEDRLSELESPDATELAFWESIKDSENRKDFDAYLARFPGGAFAGLARNRLEELADREAALVPPREARERAEPLPTGSVATQARPRRGIEVAVKAAGGSVETVRL